MSNVATRVIVGRRTKYLVLLFWLVVVAFAGPLAGKLSGVEKNDAKSWLPGKAESTQVLDEQEAFRSPNTIEAVVVYERPSGLTAADQREGRRRHRAVRRRGAHRRPDHRPRLLRGRAGGRGHPAARPRATTAGTAPAPSRTRFATSGAGSPGLAVHVTGPAGYAADSADAFKGIDGTLLFAALGVVILALLLTYRSPVLWLLPVISAGVALVDRRRESSTCSPRTASPSTPRAPASSPCSSSAPAPTTRCCSSRATARSCAGTPTGTRRWRWRCTAPARRSSRAPAPSMLGMLCLLLAETNSTKGLGPVAAIGVVIALVAMISLLPALLVICGRWVFWPARPRYGTAEPTATGFWARTGGRISRHPRRVWVGHRARARRAGDRPGRPRRQRPDQQGVLPRQPGLGHRRGDRRPALPGRRRHAGRRHRRCATPPERCGPPSRPWPVSSTCPSRRSSPARPTCRAR